MKRMVIFLLVLLCLVPPALAEDESLFELTAELSRYEFDSPQEVMVDIVVTNVSGEDMIGPMALYAPNGQMIREFGTPTLKAGESLEWQGVWNVTEQQLNAGKVVFALMYCYQNADGGMERKTQAYYKPVAWAEKPPRSVEIVLKGNSSTGYGWEWECVSGTGHVDIERKPELMETDEPALLGSDTRFTYVVTGVQPGWVDVCFTYARPWERTTLRALYTLHYDIFIDDDLNVAILGSSFDW